VVTANKNGKKREERGEYLTCHEETDAERVGLLKNIKLKGSWREGKEKEGRIVGGGGGGDVWVSENGGLGRRR